MTRIPRSRLRRWAFEIGSVVGLALALGSKAECATTLSIEMPKESRAGPAAPPVLLVHDLVIPEGGATVSVNATVCNSLLPAHLTTLFVLGGGNNGSVRRDMRAAIEASPDLLSALQLDPSATLTLTVCARGSGACTTSSPFPVRFER